MTETVALIIGIVVVETRRGHPALAACVQGYRFRSQPIPSDRQRLVFPARNTQFLEFYLADVPEVINTGESQAARVPTVVAVGPQSMGRVELFLSGRLRTFTIQFRPTGFFRLFGVPLDPLAGKGECARSVLGGQIAEFQNALEASATFDDMVKNADRILLRIQSARGQTPDPVRVIHRALETRRRAPMTSDPYRVDALVEASGYSTRQFERYFKQIVGVSPKRYLRVERLQHALAIKRSVPEASWAAVAIDAGFHDQMHLIHEFKALGGDPPARLLSLTDGERPWSPH